MSPARAEALLALGANLGDPLESLRRAAEALGGVLVGMRVGGVYRSSAEDGSAQPEYLNTAVRGGTELTPEALLEVGHALERAAGRERGAPGGPRTLDVDLVLLGAEVREGPGLLLPHPRWRTRPFVLLPALDVAPDLVDPVTGRTVAETAAAAGVGPGALPRVAAPGALAPVGAP